jgi:glycosyltransferase involved in cell wall biosynthesis
VNVLLSAFTCSPGQGSEPGNAWHWAMTLADFGHDVTVLTSSRYRGAILAAGPQRVEFRFIDDPASPLRRLSPRFGMYDSYLRWQNVALLQAKMASQRYDVAHHLTWGSLHLGSMLWRLPAPLLYGPIGGGQTTPAHYWRYFGRDWPAEKLRTASTGSLLKLNSRCRETIRNSAVTLVTNSATAAACRRLGAADVRYMLAEGLPSDWLVGARPQPTGIPVVLWVGRLLPRKAPTLAVEAFAELRRTVPARLIMAGDGPLRAQLRAKVVRLGLAEDVQLLGRVSWEDVRCLYDSASVFLFTSLRDSSGAQFLEALGRGLPAVTLDHHGMGDIDVGPAALKVGLPPTPRDLPRRLASALQAILCDCEWELRSGAAVNWAAQHVWPAKAAAATQIYREIAGCHGLAG